MHVPQRPSGLRFLENLAYLVPSYQRYRDRKLRQEEDSRLRARVYGQLMQMLQTLEKMRDRWIQEAEWGDHMEHLDQRQMRIQTTAESARYCHHALNGFFSREILDTRVLDQILEVDLLILNDLEVSLDFLTEHCATVTTAPRTARSFFRVLDEGCGQLERHLITREKILAAA
ncbi:MAG: hypothetical protein KAY24_15575 [Candidatus Eisenbacteria sp.]|nr:hypothetical protein [Candidatus Eisenbacteria bacterium]